MILILGSTHDDILYFESVMTERHEETIFDMYKIEIGKIFNQQVILAYDIYTSYMSALVTNYIISKYFVILVFVVGKCVTYNTDFKAGEIAVSKRVIIGDVDQVLEANVRLGQLPHFPRSFYTQEDISDVILTSLEKRSFSNFQTATYISANVIYDSVEKIEHAYSDGFILGHKSNVVFDCTSGGVCIACHIAKVPYIAVKVVLKKVGEKTNVDNYINVLKKYADVGKAIVTTIGEIGRNEIIRS
ncbi:MAG: hypothetical protein IJQ67_00095 [Bacilli bacterium]|nr:hypothetical protein [Bacilli bacterium]